MRLRTSRALTALMALGGLVGALSQALGGCQQSPVTVPVRSLEGSGKVSFVCLAAPGTLGYADAGAATGGADAGSDRLLYPEALDLSACTAQQFTSTCEYSYEDDAGDVDAGTSLPHLYALVTQTTRGEVAVIDTSALAGAVLDENPRQPGNEFLHVGALPTGIVSTPGGTATFVGVGELDREGLFALPSSQIRPLSASGIPDTCLGTGGGGGMGTYPLYDQPVTGLTSWPACHLPSAPGDMILIDDPANAQGERPTCDSAYSPPTASDPISLHELHGRPKLVMTMPELGGILVVDAQWLYTQPPGSFNDCEIERWLPLTLSSETLQQLGGQPEPYSGLACANPAALTEPLKPTYRVTPGNLSYANGTLYVSDLTAPVVHVVDMRGVDETSNLPILTPCNPIERAPLLPTSAENTARVVFAAKVAVAPAPTPDFKTYLFASDVEDASVMVFDVSPNSSTRRPLTRSHPEWNPFQPRDRIKFSAPTADLIVVQHDVPAIDPVTGVAKAGVLCDPNPNAINCIQSNTTCDIGTTYQTSVDYTTGAGPAKLRGEFAFAALSNGKLAVIDVSDFDAPCRTPLAPSTLAGCATNAAAGTTLIKSAGDLSCNTVEPFAPRNLNYMAVGVDPGNHVPGLENFPLLYRNDGSVFDAPTGTPPMMIATLPGSGLTPGVIPPKCEHQICDPLACGTACDTLPGCPLQLFVGGVQTPLNLTENGNACSGPQCSADADCQTVGNPTAVCDATLKVCVTSAPCKQNSDCMNGTCQVNGVCTGYMPGLIGPSSAPNNAVLMNLQDPRAHLVDQNWTVTFEGAIPGFEQRIANVTVPSVITATSPAKVVDANSRYCDSGVLSEAAFTEMIAAQPLPEGSTLDARALADYVQITQELPDVLDPYWNTAVALNGTVYPPSCSFSECLALFGTTQQPELNVSRDLAITEAYQDHVNVTMRNDVPVQCTPEGQSCAQNQPCCSNTNACVEGKCQCPAGASCVTPTCNTMGTMPAVTTCTRPISLIDLQCCFPTALAYTVRGGNQWMVVGDQSGFIHHVVADVKTGECRNSCDSTMERKNARVIESSPTSGIIYDRSPTEIDPSPRFMNPMFRFAALSGTGCNVDSDCANGVQCMQGVCGVNQLDGHKCSADPEKKKSCPLNTQCDCSVSKDPCEGDCYAFVPTAAITPRDSIFRFSTNASFAPLLIPLATDSTVLVEPQAITYSLATGEVAITDGSLNGLIFVSLASATVTRSYF
jgi:hypothetical protein